MEEIQGNTEQVTTSTANVVTMPPVALAAGETGEPAPNATKVTAAPAPTPPAVEASESPALPGRTTRDVIAEARMALLEQEISDINAKLEHHGIVGPR